MLQREGHLPKSLQRIRPSTQASLHADREIPAPLVFVPSRGS